MLLSVLVISSLISELYCTLCKKKTWLIALVPLLVTLIVIGLNRSNGDYWWYELIFNEQRQNYFYEPGYSGLNELLYTLGFRYEALVFLVGLLFGVTLIRFIPDLVHLPLVLLPYAIYPLVYDIHQTRNFIMYLLAMLGLKFYVEHKTGWAFTFIMLAISFHRSALIFLPLFLLIRLKRDLYFKIILIMTAAIFIIEWLTPVFLLPLVSNLSASLPGTLSLFNDFQFRPSRLRYILMIGVDILSAFTLDWIRGKEKIPSDRFFEASYRLLIYPVLAAPLVFAYAQAYRLHRNMQLIKYIYAARLFNQVSHKSQLRIALIIALNILTAIWFIYLSDEIGIFAQLDWNELVNYQS